MRLFISQPMRDKTCVKYNITYIEHSEFKD